MWLSLVERCVRDAEVAGSNPVIPTNSHHQSSHPFQRQSRANPYEDVEQLPIQGNSSK